jgi:hypothetical protein
MNHSNKIRTLEEAYLSMVKRPALPSTDTEGTVSTSPVKEIAPGVKVSVVDSTEDESCDMCGDDTQCECSAEESDTTGQPVTMGVVDHEEHGMEGDSRFSANDEDEEDDMTIDNIHSIKESLMKISLAVAAGVHLEPWQQFKVAIVMDNLASVARSLPRQQHGCF